MEAIAKSVKKILPLAKKSKKYLPFFIGFKLLTFTGFLAFIMNRKMIFPPAQVVFGLLLLSIALVFIWDIRYSPFGEDEDGI